MVQGLELLNQSHPAYLTLIQCGEFNSCFSIPCFLARLTSKSRDPQQWVVSFRCPIQPHPQGTPNLKQHLNGPSIVLLLICLNTQLASRVSLSVGPLGNVWSMRHLLPLFVQQGKLVLSRTLEGIHFVLRMRVAFRCTSR